jgi:hypothetical protein
MIRVIAICLKGEAFRLQLHSILSRSYLGGVGCEFAVDVDDNEPRGVCCGVIRARFRAPNASR